MNPPQGMVHIVDDDPDMRKALARLCQISGLTTRTFESAREFLEAGVTDSPACLVLDVRMPGLSGLDLQTELAKRDIRTPIVFITGHGNIPTSVRAMKAGAVDFLTKPFRNQDVLGVIRTALGKDAAQREAQAEREAIRKRLNTLTPRERQVFDFVIQGFLSKQIAGELGTSDQTIKVHRGRIMHKMQVDSVAELVQLAMKADVMKL